LLEKGEKNGNNKQIFINFLRELIY
jgi:hypothetical protein